MRRHVAALFKKLSRSVRPVAIVSLTRFWTAACGIHTRFFNSFGHQNLATSIVGVFSAGKKRFCPIPMAKDLLLLDDGLLNVMAIAFPWRNFREHPRLAEMILGYGAMFFMFGFVPQ